MKTVDFNSVKSRLKARNIKIKKAIQMSELDMYWEIQSRNSDTLVKTPKSLHLIPQLTIPERM